MGDLTSFQVRKLLRADWDCFVNKIDRRFYNEKKSIWENMSVEEYLKKLIHKLSQLKREDIANIIKSDAKIKIEC